VIGFLVVIGCTPQPSSQPASASPSASPRSPTASSSVSPSASLAVDAAAIQNDIRTACRISTFLDDLTCEQVDEVAVTGETTLTLRTKLVSGAVDERAAAICRDMIDYFGGDENEYGLTRVEILGADGQTAAGCDFPRHGGN
jgi:hypothetical protein